MKNTRDKPQAKRSAPESVDATGTDKRYPQDELEETVIVMGDIMEPVLPEEYWESLKS